MNEPARLINGALLRLQREGKGWAQTDLATRSCLSLRQVRQLKMAVTVPFTANLSRPLQPEK